MLASHIHNCMCSRVRNTASMSVCVVTYPCDIGVVLYTQVDDNSLQLSNVSIKYINFSHAGTTESIDTVH